ncbi:DUF6679 family protein [Neosynechococcus sphagnicola]|uniref:DUF6679 family protein n=1 Tax=Neosynechococcus sphagnicola TaxID=1501145 RepID=UPI000AF1B68C|nr:DUF6679 family protein [Neosynechococcus sphagnicola]
MLHRKIYQLHSEGREVNLFLRDQQRWIYGARVIDVEGDLVTLRYEETDEEETCSYEEMVRLESIGAVSKKLASVPRIAFDIPVSDDCPEAEQLHNRYPDPNLDVYGGIADHGAAMTLPRESRWQVHR